MAKKCCCHKRDLIGRMNEQQFKRPDLGWNFPYDSVSVNCNSLLVIFITLNEVGDEELNKYRASKSESYSKVFSVCCSMIDNFAISIFTVAGHSCDIIF